MGVGEAAFGQHGGHLRRGTETVGVDPRFQRKPPAVGLGDEDVQRVEAGVFPLLPGADMAPREESAAVEGIPEGPHLHDDGVQPDGQAVIHQSRRPGPEGFFRGKIHPGPFQIAHPDSPPLPGGQGGVRLCLRGRHRQGRDGLPPAQHQPRTGQRGTACPRQKGPPPEAAAVLSPPLRHASSCIL